MNRFSIGTSKTWVSGAVPEPSLLFWIEKNRTAFLTPIIYLIYFLHKIFSSSLTSGSFIIPILRAREDFFSLQIVTASNLLSYIVNGKKIERRISPWSWIKIGEWWFLSMFLIPCSRLKIKTKIVKQIIIFTK